MDGLEHRNTQTRVKHEILSRYLDTWGGIIVSGLKARSPAEWHFVYVDCFSSVGKYAGEKEDLYKSSPPSKAVDGSPFIGIKALDRLLEHASHKMGVRIKVNTILIEKNRKTFEFLLEILQKAGYGQRLKETKNFYNLDPGQIAVVNDDCTLLANNLLPYTARRDTWAFYLIDPWGPSGIPYDFVKSVVSQDHHDVMINFIFEDLIRKTGMAIKQNPNSQEKQLVDYWTKAFGGDWWIDVARETLLNEEDVRNFRTALDGIPMSDHEGPWTDEELAEVKEQTFVSAYRDVLRSMDRDMVSKLVSLKFWDKERTMFYLFLTTHDPTGALTLNRILSDAKYLEHELRMRLRNAKKAVPPAPPENQMTLWASLPYEAKVPEPIPEPDISPRPTNEEIGKMLMSKFAGQKATRKTVFKELANTLYFPGEIDKALRYLRRNGQAAFEGDPAHKTVILFATNR